MNKTQDLYNTAKKIIPGGTQLLSKRPEMWAPEQWPAYYDKAKGCEIWDLDGNHFYDFSIMGVGANVLGYAFDEVDTAAIDAIGRSGMCTLNAPEEVILAKKLIELHPWADMVRYAKAGGEALSVAVRIARAYTRKDIVLVCGYHGWHDWYLSANLVKGDPLADVHLKGLEPIGVPSGLAGTNLIFHYNDIDEFKTLVKDNKGHIAAVIMEPIRNDSPRNSFLNEIRNITKDEGIVLIFDEVSSGFRLCSGGAHKVLGVEPDIATFAKAMTNGYPVSAIIGRGEVMQAAQETFISSTFWTERIALAAAIKSIECFIKYDVSEHLSYVGERVNKIWKQCSSEYDLDISIGGILPITHFQFNYENVLSYKTLFTQEMLNQGYLCGCSTYASLAHTEEKLKGYENACRMAFKRVADAHVRNKIEEQIKGPICHSGFERLN